MPGEQGLALVAVECGPQRKKGRRRFYYGFTSAFGIGQDEICRTIL